MKTFVSRRPHRLEMLGAGLLYALLVVLAAWLLNRLEPEGGFRYLIAVLPAGGALLLIAAALRDLLSGDELELRAAAISGLGVLALTATAAITWGILEAFTGAPAIPSLYWGVALLAGWGLCYPLILKRYQ
jgi:hypothetical protein